MVYLIFMFQSNDDKPIGNGWVLGGGINMEDYPAKTNLL